MVYRRPQSDGLLLAAQTISKHTAKLSMWQHGSCSSMWHVLATTGLHTASPPSASPVLPEAIETLNEICRHPHWQMRQLNQELLLWVHKNEAASWCADMRRA